MKVYIVMFGTEWEGWSGIGGVYKDLAEAESHAKKVNKFWRDRYAEVVESCL